MTGKKVCPSKMFNLIQNLNVKKNSSNKCQKFKCQELCKIKKKLPTIFLSNQIFRANVGNPFSNKLTISGEIL